MRTTSTERVYIVGGTGNTGKQTIRELLKAGVFVTALTRSPDAAAKQFSDLVSSEKKNQHLLTLVQGDYDDMTSFKESIQGHHRLMIIIHHPDRDNYTELKKTYTSLAYEAGVKQVVDVSGMAAGLGWRTSHFAILAQTTESALLEVANQGRGYYVALRPTQFMSNIIAFDGFGIRECNAIMDTSAPDELHQWVSPNDIGSAAAVILQDPIDKHKNAVYEMVSDYATSKDRARYLSEALGREIVHKQISYQERYKQLIGIGMSHSVAYAASRSLGLGTTPTGLLSILLDRQPETLEHYIHSNKAAFL
ncbi:NAD(P)-binding protein [Lichtheimia hyalospora FSU 10163]|nr:NAD(P)-binding protein [Lichtheimia hyalospora FSU 10163]